MFLDRTDAGKKLAQALGAYEGEAVVVYGLPRGGVVLGVEVARSLGAPLDLAVVRKVGHPMQPEYAIGAVGEDGYFVMNPDETTSSSESWLSKAIAVELQEIRRQRRVFLEGRSRPDVTGKTAIIVDDGLATGLTMEAAIHDVRQRGARKIVVAVPVAAAQTAEKIRSQVDDLVVLYIPRGWFGAIGYFYSNFDQVNDDEVIELIRSLSPAEMAT